MSVGFRGGERKVTIEFFGEREKVVVRTRFIRAGMEGIGRREKHRR